MHTAGI